MSLVSIVSFCSCLHLLAKVRISLPSWHLDFYCYLVRSYRTSLFMLLCGTYVLAFDVANTA